MRNFRGTWRRDGKKVIVGTLDYTHIVNGYENNVTGYMICLI